MCEIRFKKKFNDLHMKYQLLQWVELTENTCAIVLWFYNEGKEDKQYVAVLCNNGHQNYFTFSQYGHWFCSSNYDVYFEFRLDRLMPH